MGRAIAHICTLNDFKVILQSVNKGILKNAQSIIDANALGKRMHNVYYDLLSSSAEIGFKMLILFWGTDEAREGLQAFKEKRRSDFNQ